MKTFTIFYTWFDGRSCVDLSRNKIKIKLTSRSSSHIEAYARCPYKIQIPFMFSFPVPSSLAWRKGIEALDTSLIIVRLLLCDVLCDVFCRPPRLLSSHPGHMVRSVFGMSTVYIRFTCKLKIESCIAANHSRLKVTAGII